MLPLWQVLLRAKRGVYWLSSPSTHLTCKMRDNRENTLMNNQCKLMHVDVYRDGLESIWCGVRWYDQYQNTNLKWLINHKTQPSMTVFFQSIHLNKDISFRKKTWFKYPYFIFTRLLYWIFFIFHIGSYPPSKTNIRSQTNLSPTTRIP